mmetsp:Transcript_13568/g.17865  ORF Transcript_13568/g.17865 Transcript_13568/m.17865 type:complete len:126 (+) Transcript_13568:58-435(+)
MPRSLRKRDASSKQVSHVSAELSPTGNQIERYLVEALFEFCLSAIPGWYIGSPYWGDYGANPIVAHCLDDPKRTFTAKEWESFGQRFINESVAENKEGTMSFEHDDGKTRVYSAVGFLRLGFMER